MKPVDRWVCKSTSLPKLPACVGNFSNLPILPGQRPNYPTHYNLKQLNTGYLPVLKTVEEVQDGRRRQHLYHLSNHLVCVSDQFHRESAGLGRDAVCSCSAAVVAEAVGAAVTASEPPVIVVAAAAVAGIEAVVGLAQTLVVSASGLPPSDFVLPSA